VENAFQIASWLARPSLNTVSLNEKTVHLEPKMMEVLVCLAEHAGETVLKEKLIQAVWPDTFVTDDVLTRSISELRRVFEDDAREPRFIQTIPKRGYRLLAPVTPLSSSAPTVALHESPAPTQDTAAGVPQREPWLPRAAVIGGLAAFLLALSAVGISFPGVLAGLLGRGPTPAIHSLAVLPLQNLSGDPNQDYFADGMTEELITEISRLNALKVISRTSIMRYKKTDKSLPQIAHALNVDAIVEGSVLRSGDRVRVTAQLIYARTDASLWAETYDRTLQDTLAVQEAVASAIAGRIKSSLDPSGIIQSKAPKVVNLKAHEAYLLGLHEDALARGGDHGMQVFNEEHSRRAIEYYKQALREDPNYAPVYVELARAAGTNELGNDLNEVEVDLRKALKLDDSLSAAHVLLGALLLFRDLNWQGAEKEVKRAIELNPSNAGAHQAYAYFLDATDRLDEGMREYQLAQELDPAIDRLGGALYSRREYSRLIELERRSLATNPPGSEGGADALAHKVLMVAYARTGKRKESIEEFRSALVCKGFDGLADEVRRGYLRSGYEGAWRAYLKGKTRTDFSFAFVDVYAYTELGDYDQAFARLAALNKDDPGEWAWQEDSLGISSMPSLATLGVEPMWDPLHSDPRFEALARRVRFPQ
jgi:TolB-like protein/DNA-binding winged helix-turn-helix (wHTH) protein